MNYLEMKTTEYLDFCQYQKRLDSKTVNRKIASLKAFFRYPEYRNDIEINPFNKMQIKFREPVILPETIPPETLENLLVHTYINLIK